jgi:hypothetical protein
MSVTESIFSGTTVIVPLADVQHIEIGKDGGIAVITKHTRWDREGDYWANNIFIGGEEAVRFRAAWCRYRSELEADTLADLSDQPANSLVRDDAQFGMGA